MLSGLVITFLPRSKRLLISWLQSPHAVILELRKIKSATVATVSPSIFHDVMGPDAMKSSTLEIHLVASCFLDLTSCLVNHSPLVPVAPSHSC